MTAASDETRRRDFVEAVDLVDSARKRAESIVSEAQRQADMIRIEAEADAASRRNEGELYLKKARAVLEIAQARATGGVAPDPARDLAAAIDDAGGVHPAVDHIVGGDVLDDLIDLDAPTAPPGDKLPGEFDRMLVSAVSKAVDETLRGADKLFIGR